MTQKHIHVVIAGAGLGGLCLAQKLKKQGIAFTVFEKDESTDSRPQGYRIRIDQTGQRALAACLPPDLFHLFRQTCALSNGRAHFLDPQLAPIGGRPSESWETGDLSVNRLTLREILLAGIRDNVRFGKSFDRFEEHEDGSVTVTFHDGETIKADLLVAADGVNSAVCRQRLPSIIPQDTGTACIYGKTRLAPDSAVADLLKSGTSVIFARDLAVVIDAMSFRFPGETKELTPVEDYLYWAIIGRRTRLGLSDATLPDTVARLVSDWAPGLRALFAEADARTIAALPIRAAPELRPWTASRVTVLGDAIHVMSPAGGLGANTALRDAQILGDRLAEAAAGQSSLLAAVSLYENNMRRHANAAIEASREGAGRLFGEESFVVHDPSDFPVVLTRPEAVVPGYAARWETEMEALLGRQQPFVVIFPASRVEETQEDRKRRGLWLKANKEALARLCLSVITVERDRLKRTALKAQTAMAAKAFGIPMEIVSSFEEASTLAQWLTRPAQASAR